jgi:PEP-CTERM motif
MLRFLPAGFLVAACSVSNLASASPAAVVALSEDSIVFHDFTYEVEPERSIPFDAIAGADDFSVGHIATRGLLPSLNPDIAQLLSPTTTAHDATMIVTSSAPRNDVPEPPTIILVGLGLVAAARRLVTSIRVRPSRC